MHGHIDSAWRVDGRGFWTKRKKSAMSLVSILALLAGIAVAFKLFEQEVPNNVVRDASVFDFEIEKFEEDIDNNFEDVGALDPNHPIFESPLDNLNVNGKPQQDQFPGDSRTVEVRITNTNTNPEKDASFEMYISSIEVFGCTLADGSAAPADFDAATNTSVCPQGGTFGLVTPNTQAWNRFVNWWSLEVDKQTVLAVPVFGSDLYQDHVFETKTGSCDGGLKEISKAAPCDLGMIREVGATDVVDQPTDHRLYDFTLTEADDGSDQSNWKGWYLNLDFIFQARIPALPESTPTGTRT